MLIVSLGARAVLGLSLGVVLSFVGWMIAWNVRAFPGTTSFEVVTVLSIGGMVAIGAILAWWNPSRPTSVVAAYIVLTFGGALLSAWIAYERAVTVTRYTFLGEGILLPMMYASIIGANLVASVLSTYRMVRYREV